MSWPFGTVAVDGPSMLPTLRPGDYLMVRRGAPVRVGDVVVARFPARPGLLVVKRVRAAAGTGWWLEGDNPDPGQSDDSRRYGPVPARDVVARVVARYWPPRSAGRVGAGRGGPVGFESFEGSEGQLPDGRGLGA